MRLIDADEVILHLNDFILQQSPIDAQDIESINVSAVIQDCIKVVEQQPTAYDIYEVIAQLDEKIARLDSRQQICYEAGDFKTSDKMADKMVAFIESKNIVKKEVKK